jgi:hypothetical protein
MATLIGKPKAIGVLPRRWQIKPGEPTVSSKQIACIELKTRIAANNAGIKYTYSGSESRNPPFSSRLYKAIESRGICILKKLPRYSYTPKMLEW